MPKVKETDFVSSLKNYLERCGAYVIRIKPVRMRCHKCGQFAIRSCQEAGVPDLIVCYKGKFAGLEAKLPGNKMSPQQEVHKMLIQQAGGICLEVKYWKRRNVYAEIAAALGMPVII